MSTFLPIQTSSWFQFRGAGRIGISRGLPRGVVGGYRRYGPLAPNDYVWETEGRDEYRERYLAQLDALDPSQVLVDLYRLAGTATPVLCCFCDLRRPGSWCHRTIFAQWFTDRTGVEVVELSATAIKATRKREQLALF